MMHGKSNIKKKPFKEFSDYFDVLEWR